VKLQKFPFNGVLSLEKYVRPASSLDNKQAYVLVEAFKF